MSNTILVIEDNANMRENTSELLELSGYSVIVAENGKEGLDLARKNKLDLILCDIMMPELDGYGVKRALENIPELLGVPFVFISAKSEKSDFRLGMDLGADDYLTKPFSGDDLLKVVAARIKKSNQIENSKKTIEGLKSLTEVPQILLHLSELTKNKAVKKLNSKEFLFMEGDNSNYLYFVKSGKVKTFKTNESGKEYITGIISTNEFFGYASLLGENEHPDSAAAIEDSEIILIPGQDFHKLLNSNNEMSLKFMKFITDNLLETENRLLNQAYNSSRKNVAESILYLYRKSLPLGETGHFPFRREDLSSIAGVSPESISRTLTDFRDEGLIETGNGTMKILELRKLETIKN